MPAHVAIAGNETADRLAKAAAKLPQPHLSSYHKEVKTLLKQKQKSAWRLKNNEYDLQKDQINTVERRTAPSPQATPLRHPGKAPHHGSQISSKTEDKQLWSTVYALTSSRFNLEYQKAAYLAPAYFWSTSTTCQTY